MTVTNVYGYKSFCNKRMSNNIVFEEGKHYKINDELVFGKTGFCFHRIPYTLILENETDKNRKFGLIVIEVNTESKNIINSKFIDRSFCNNLTLVKFLSRDELLDICNREMKWSLSNGVRISVKDGNLHSYNDKSIIRDVRIGKTWYFEGNIHRNNNPAVIEYSRVAWYKHGIKHRDDTFPAETYSDGTTIWWVNGEMHRDGDKPAIIYSDGGTEYLQHGVLHRDGDKPAIIDNSGNVYFYKNGLLHRDNGLPAVVLITGKIEFWTNGEFNTTNKSPKKTNYSKNQLKCISAIKEMIADSISEFKTSMETEIDS